MIKEFCLQSGKCLFAPIRIIGEEIKYRTFYLATHFADGLFVIFRWQHAEEGTILS